MRSRRGQLFILVFKVIDGHCFLHLLGFKKMHLKVKSTGDTGYTDGLLSLRDQVLVRAPYIMVVVQVSVGLLNGARQLSVGK